MTRIIRIYQKLLGKHPLATQAVQAGILMGLGDQAAQNFVEKRKFKDLDLVRTAQFAGIGFCITGPVTRIWYGILNKYIGSKGRTVALKKVACDQLFFAPMFLATLLSIIGILQGNNVQSLKRKLNSEYPEILKNNYKLWPMVQLVNFYFVPLPYQVLVVQSIALIWSIYISYRTNL